MIRIGTLFWKHHTSCFRTMAIVAAVIIPGIFLFRVLRPNTVLPTAV